MIFENSLKVENIAYSKMFKILMHVFRIFWRKSQRKAVSQEFEVHWSIEAFYASFCEIPKFLRECLPSRPSGIQGSPTLLPRKTRVASGASRNEEITALHPSWFIRRFVSEIRIRPWVTLLLLLHMHRRIYSQSERRRNLVLYWVNFFWHWFANCAEISGYI